MARRSKKDRPPAIIQGVLADNVQRLRDRLWPELPNQTQRNERIAKDSDTSLSQIVCRFTLPSFSRQRIINQELAPGIDIVERLATALNVRPQDLLTPYFAAQAYRPTLVESVRESDPNGLPTT
jgi:hypothetical protein